MTRRSRQISDTVFLADGNERVALTAADRRQPHVGIWWHNDVSIVAVLQPLDGLPSELNVVDSELGHVLEWPLVAKPLKQPVTADYFLVPRGRVLFDRHRERGLIYHGNRTDQARLRRIAKVFGLSDWDARLDDHYLMDDAVDELFGDE